MRRVWGLTMASLLVVALAGTACGESKASAETIVRSTSSKTAKAKTAKMAISVIGSGSHTSAINVNGEGVVDLAGRRADLTVDAGSAVGGKIRMLMIGTIIYMQLPQNLASQVPGGKPFVKIDLQQVGQQQGIDIAALQQQNPDAASQLAFLNGAGADFHSVGKENVRGAETTHFQGTVDLAKAAQAAATPELKDAMTKTQQKLGSSSLPMDVWIDGQGRMRKLTYSMDIGKLAAANGGPAQTGTLTETIELFDYGVKVNVAEPPADQVTDLSALLAGAGAGAKKP